MSTYLDPEEARRLAESSGQIHMRAFQIAVGVLTGLALCCFVARIGIRIRYQKGLRLDDVFLIIAAACLCAATGILYHICYFLYLHSAALLVPQMLPYLLANWESMLSLQKRVYPFLALIWTTTFAVKGCFLAFMRPLVWHISRAMNWYYWVVVVFCVLSWAFVVADPFIICPYFGLDAVKCFSSTVDGKKTLGLTILVTVLDIVSDVMVVSLPIIVLWGSQLSRSTKFGLAVFLCLSIFMAACAIARIAGFHYKGREDDTWEFFWQHVEGAVAVMMASITAFRTLFVRSSEESNETTPRSPAGSWIHRILGRFQTLARAKPEEKPSTAASIPELKLPKLPSPVLTGLRSLIRRNNRTGVGSHDVNSFDSGISSVSDDYHTILKAKNGSDTSKDDLESGGKQNLVAAR